MSPVDAVNVALPAVVDLAVNVATPLAFVVLESVVIVSVTPRLEASVTVIPETRFVYVSFSVTVNVATSLPFAMIVEDATLKVD